MGFESLNSHKTKKSYRKLSFDKVKCKTFFVLNLKTNTTKRLSFTDYRKKLNNLYLHSNFAM